MHIVPKRGRGRPRYPGILTPAEARVLRGLRGGMTNAAIAAELGVSVNTVRSHRSIKDRAGDAHARIERARQTRRAVETRAHSDGGSHDTEA